MVGEDTQFPRDLKRVVVKLGTGVLRAEDGTVDAGRINRLAAEIASLRARGIEPIVVSSGAVGLGMGRLKKKSRPRDTATLQACAAVGQSILTETWQAGFAPHGLTVAQLLLTREDVRARARHLAIRDLLEKMLGLGLIPLINENDSVRTEELTFGDNDLLSALVASLLKADLLVILSTAEGLVDRTGSGEIVPVVAEITPVIRAMAGGTESATAVGGMASKLDAAEVALRSGCGVFIGSGARPALLQEILTGHAPGTFFVPAKLDMGARQRWLAFFEKPRGTVLVDPGARRALVEEGSSLLAKGVTGCTGTFHAGDAVAVTLAENGSRAFARGLVRYSSADLAEIAGLTSDDIRKKFPDRKKLEVIHRDAMVLVG